MAKAPVPTFGGFAPETLKFLKALGFHQSRDWFEANRALYLASVKEPMERYVEALSAACAARKSPLRGDPKRSTFRLNRDVRFSKDKRPYKTNAGCVLTRTGAKGSPGLLYTHVAPDGCFFATGFYHPEPPQLLAMRKAIVKRGRSWLAIEQKLENAGLALSHDDALTRNPQGFQAAEETLWPALRLRNFIVRKPFADTLLLKGESMVSAAADFAKASQPLLDFGWTAME